MTIRSAHFAALIALLLVPPALAQDVPPTEELPPSDIPFAGGATAISETHGDWTVICGTRTGEQACVINQSLADEQTGQRVLAVELENEANGAVAGSLVLPFGLRLGEGVRTQVDAVTVGDTLPIRVCYDYGCVARLSFDANTATLLRKGTALRLVGTVDESGEDIALSVSLRGISSALDRGAALLSE